MAYSHLEHMLGNSIIHSVNQLRSILYDLKDLGLISIKFMVLRHDARFFRDFKLPKNVEEEFITLLVDVDKIMIAYDADERENGKSAFNPMNRWRSYFTINRYWLFLFKYSFIFVDNTNQSELNKNKYEFMRIS